MIAKLSALCVAALALCSAASARDLDPETAKAWDQYIQNGDSQLQQRADGTKPFMWIDDVPARREAARRGEIVVEPKSKEGPQRLAHGLVYDWMGAVFIPNTTIPKLFEVLSDYDRYNQIYDPAVVRAKLLEDSGLNQRFSMTVVEKAPLVTTVFESEYKSESHCVDAKHCYSILYTTRIQQIENYKKPDEHKLPPDGGYVWRVYSIQRYEERDGGVYTELEAMALSRDIPFEFRWLARPFLQHLPRNSMIGTLEKTRDAVCARAKSNPENPGGDIALNGNDTRVAVRSDMPRPGPARY